MPHSRFLLALSCLSLSAVLFAGAFKVWQIIELQAIGSAHPGPAISWGLPKLDIDPSFFHVDADMASSSQESKSSQGSISTGADLLPAKPQADVDVKTVPPAEAPRPEITAYSYIVGNIRTGKIYLQLNPDVRVPIASMSKLLTAIIATDTLSPTSTIEISAQAALAPPDQSGIAAGERYEAQQLLYPLLLDSSNVAAEALSASKDRAAFLEHMSSYAWEIGMSATYFADPSGVDPHNASSAKDFFALARYLSAYRPDILALTRTVRTSVASTTDHAAHEFRSIHPFVGDQRFIGGKTGRTPEAGETMLTMMRIKGEEIAIVVLGSEYAHRGSDTSLLIDKVSPLIK